MYSFSKRYGKSFVREYFDGSSSQAPNHQIKINISDSVIIDSVLASADSYVARSTNGTFNLNNVLAYFLSNDIDDVGSDLYSLPDAHYYGEIKNCYLACSNDCVNIKDSFNPVFSRISREQCLSSSTFNDWDFSNTWKIDSKMGFPVPKIFSERYVYLYYRRREETMLCLESGTSNRSPGFNLRGFYGMVERGSNISFGMVSLFGGSWKSFMEIRNVYTNALPDDDFVDYNNIQESVIKEYTIKPFFTDGTGEGTPDNPFKINNFQDYVSSVYLTTLEPCFNGTYHDINQAKTFYCSIEQDIICNDISDFNEWDNRRPANVLDLENLPGRSDFYLSGGVRNCYDGKNHKIIGLCGKSSSGVPNLGSFANTSVAFKNTVFDYIYGYFSTFTGASLAGRFERCEFNGMFYFKGNGYFYCNECSFNLLPSINSLGDSYGSYNINTVLKISSSYEYPQLYATDCVFNGGFAELSGYSQRSTYTSCVFYGKYKQLYGNRVDSSLQLSNCYFIDEDVYDKQDFEGAIFLTREQYNEASNFSLDFDSIFEMNVDRGGPVLRGMAPRFKIFTALNLDQYGLTSVSKYKYFASNNESVTLSVTVTPNSLSHFSQWSDGDKSNPRTVVLDKDMVLAYKLPPFISGLDGDGTEQSPYLIKTKENLNRLVSYCNSASWYNLNDVYAKQTEDIIYQDTTEWATWEQLGAPETFTPFISYKGVYDGDGHSISGLYIQGENRPGSNNQTYVTFMRASNLTSRADAIHIKNLTIKESLYVNTPKVRCYMSGLMYDTNDYSTVENCTFSGELYSEYSGDMAGIYVGTAPTIKKCTFKGKIINKSGGQVLAGIAVAIANGASYQRRAIIEQCASAGTIELSGVPNITSSTNFQYYGVAGIVGLNGGYGGYFTITECYNATEIKGIKNVWVSGICNLYKGSLYINDCYNIGDIESQAQSQTVADLSEFNCSGIANVTSDLSAYIERCYNYGTIVCLDTNGENKSGYAVSPRRGSKMENCFYLINTGKNTIDSIKPLSAVEFSQASNFTGFNFVKIWQMDASEGRPKLIANMEYGLLNLLLSVSNKDYGIVSGGGRYEYGSEVTIVATPYSGCSFRQWSDGGRKNPRKIVLTSNQQLQAIFKGGVPIRLLDYFGLVQFWTNIQMYFAGMLARKVDKIQAGDEDTPVYFNANGVPTVCTSLDLDTTGNAGSATKLANAVNIAGVPFDGTQDIDIETTTDTTYAFIDSLPEAGDMANNDVGISESDYSKITYSMIDDIIK